MANIRNIPRTLIAIGYWQSEHEPDLPHPKNFVNDKISAEERELLIEYLEKGRRHLSFLGYSYCRFNCGIQDYEMGTSCLSDGKYIWPEKLSHYIREHNVWLPKQFILHVKDNRNFNLLDVDLKNHGLGNYEWWKNYDEQK